MEDESNKIHKLIHAVPSAKASFMLSIKAGCIVIASVVFLIGWGISLSGYRETPSDFIAATYLIFWPSLLILSDNRGVGEGPFSLFILQVAISTITWSILAFCAHRIYCIYLRYRLKKASNKEHGKNTE